MPMQLEVTVCPQWKQPDGMSAPTFWPALILAHPPTAAKRVTQELQPDGEGTGDGDGDGTGAELLLLPLLTPMQLEVTAFPQ